MKTYAPDQVTLVYQDESGEFHYQSVSDVVEVGTLIDPDTGDDMEIVNVMIGQAR